MGGKISFAICVIAALLLLSVRSYVFFSIAILIAIINFWSWGVMHNYFLSARYNIDAVPDWISTINMISAIGGLILLTIAVAKSLI